MTGKERARQTRSSCNRRQRTVAARFVGAAVLLRQAPARGVHEGRLEDRHREADAVGAEDVGEDERVQVDDLLLLTEQPGEDQPGQGREYGIVDQRRDRGRTAGANPQLAAAGPGADLLEDVDVVELADQIRA